MLLPVLDEPAVGPLCGVTHRSGGDVETGDQPKPGFEAEVERGRDLFDGRRADVPIEGGEGRRELGVGAVRHRLTVAPGGLERDLSGRGAAAPDSDRSGLRTPGRSGRW